MREIVIETMKKLTDEEVKAITNISIDDLDDDYVYIEEDEYDVLRMSQEAKDIMTKVNVVVSTKMDYENYRKDKHLNKKDIVGIAVEGSNARIHMKNGNVIVDNVAPYLSDFIETVYVWKGEPVAAWNPDDLSKAYDLYRMVSDVHDAINSAGIGNDAMEASGVDTQFILTNEETALIKKFIAENPEFNNDIVNFDAFNNHNMQLLYSVQYR